MSPREAGVSISLSFVLEQPNTNCTTSRACINLSACKLSFGGQRYRNRCVQLWELSGCGDFYFYFYFYFVCITPSTVVPLIHVVLFNTNPRITLTVVA